QVCAADGSEVIRIYMLGQNPGDTKKIVDAVQRAFMSEVIQKDVAEKGVFLRKVEDAKQQMQRLLEDRSKKPDAVKAGGPVVPGIGVQPAENKEPNVLPPLAPNAPGGAAAAVPPLPGKWDDLLTKFNPKALVDRFAGHQAECERLPTEISLCRGRLREIEGKINALRTAPIDPTTYGLVDKDDDVIRQS